MNFTSDSIYHIYNRGNQQQKIFFNRENYLFFLKKMRVELSPYCEFINYCLMPNHFHWLVKTSVLISVRPLGAVRRICKTFTRIASTIKYSSAGSPIY
ncbi:MAG: transposase [Bacteroidetes bacterium]|nr:transposase [Bacteroidota bacterium]